MQSVYFGRAVMSKIDWTLVDWSKRTCDLSREYNVTVDTISRYRRRFAPSTLSQRLNHWDSVDWTKNNRQLAQELGKSYDTVAKKRWQLKQSGKAIKRAVRTDKGQKKPQMAHGAVNQPLATEAAKSSLKSGKFATNVHAKVWLITSPNNERFVVKNLYQFVRDNKHLFLAEDVVFKRQGGKRGTGGEYCNATSGLIYAASKRGRGRWKDWQCQQLTGE